jgi:ATP-dependent DNA helicase RecG
MSNIAISSIDIFDALELGEDTSLEFKEASGKDGEGALPKSFFQTYVAMANTHGGTIVLGIREKPKGTFTISGIKNPSGVIKQVWDELNNRQQVSVNLLTNEMISVFNLQGRNIIRVRIPRAIRSQRPVYLGLNPLAGTYRRNHEGDYLCDSETVKRMLAEQVEQNRDCVLLEGYRLDDIDSKSLASYRQQFKATKPDHPWLDLDDLSFLRAIGAWTVNRETGSQGLTLAGLLMFGRMRSILDAVPNYILDYQERPQPKADARWIDRVTTDGTWSGNLFEFYRIVFKKLTNDLKIPFNLKGASRVDETPLHEALREAFINTLIHADYTGRVSVLIVKRPDMFGFRNPGMMRLPLEEALLGGQSDCRNRNLQKMFQLVGLGEQAGSGIPKIWRNWQQQHWRSPELSEQVEPDQTILALRMVSLFPQEVLDELDRRFGSKLQTFSELQRLALATVCIEGYVTHRQLKSMSVDHSRDITMGLAALVREGIFESAGVAKGTYYYFATEPPRSMPLFEDIATFGAFQSQVSVPSSVGSVPLDDSSVPLSSVPSDSTSVPLAVPPVPLPDLMDSLKRLAEPVRSKKKASKAEVRAAIVQLCGTDFIPVKILAQLLGRSGEYLRIKHLNEMVANGQLSERFPNTPSHPQQSYRSARQA